MFLANLKPILHIGSGEELYFVVFAIFRNDGRLGFLT